MSSAAAILSTSELACRRGERRLFAGLSLELREGELVWLRGGNGRGKTSLLRLLAGLAGPDAGGLSWRGRPLERTRDELAGELLYLAHANAIKDDLSAAEALGFLARVHGQHADRPALLRALDALAIASRRDAMVRTLSQGQRRRVALARLALAPAKPLWLLDEPYDALDADGCRIVDALIAGHVRGGGAVLLTSHLPLAITDPAPRVVDLDAAAAGAAR